MKVSEYVNLLCRALPSGRRILAVGPPGVGKSFGAREACLNIDWDFIPICAPLQSPVKIGGYPRPPLEPGGDATHALFDGVAMAFRATRPTLLFWDDLGMAGGETLKAIVDLVQFGRIDNRTLPGCVVVGGASNDIGHGADVVGMIEPLKTRWDSIIKIETCVEDVVQYGLSKGWPVDLCAFLRNQPDALHDWKPSKSLSIDGATPRGWEHVAEWVNIGIDDSEVLEGCVGRGRAVQYLAYRRLCAELPDVDALLLSPETAPVPENPAARYFVATALSAKLSAGNFGQAMKYLMRLDQMFRAFCVRDAFQVESRRRDSKSLPENYVGLASSRGFTAWASSSDGQSILSAVGSARGRKM